MPHGLSATLQLLLTSVIGGGVGAGVVTFALNFWKGERDTRRANLEKLYTAVHKYTLSMSEIAMRIRTGRFTSEDQSKLTEQTEHFDLISLLIDLYFPQLKPIFDSFVNKNQGFIDMKEESKADRKKLEEDFSDLIQEGENLKRAVVGLARELEMFPAG